MYIVRLPVLTNKSGRWNYILPFTFYIQLLFYDQPDVLLKEICVHMSFQKITVIRSSINGHIHMIKRSGYVKDFYRCIQRNIPIKYISATRRRRVI